MKWLAWVALILQIGWALFASRYTPDYYVRSADSVREWAYSRGLWVLAISVALACVDSFVAFRVRRAWATALAVLSWVFALVWILNPYFYSGVGDAVYFRFP